MQRKVKIAYILYKCLIIFMTILFIGFALVNLYFYIYEKKNDKIGYIYDSSLIKVTTDSMYPSIKPFQDVIIKKQNDYRAKDIIAYKNQEKKIMIIHRIIEKDNGMVITKGDNNDFLDDSFEDKYILGKVINFDYDKNKLITFEMFNFQKNPLNLFLISFFYVGFFVFKEVIKNI